MKGRRGQRGQGLVEFAFTAIIFFTVILFIFDGGRIIWNYVTLSEAARAGARYAITHGMNSANPQGPNDGHAGIDTAVKNSAFGLNLSPTVFQISTSWDGSDPGYENEPGNHVTVQLTYAVTPITKLFWPRTPLTLHAQSRMVIQN